MVRGPDRAYVQCMASGKNLSEPKVILVTGASSGIGWATAERFRMAGHKVFGTSRSPEAKGPVGVTMLALVSRLTIHATVRVASSCSDL
jgi:NAD(P)-dependent dehydrogenase (short-subunit alcohol dehydrogenase family)